MNENTMNNVGAEIIPDTEDIEIDEELANEILDDTPETSTLSAPAQEPAQEPAGSNSEAGADNDVAPSTERRAARSTRVVMKRQRETREEREARNNKYMATLASYQDAVARHKLVRGQVSTAIITEKLRNSPSVAVIEIKIDDEFKAVIPYHEVFQESPIRELREESPEALSEELLRRELQVLRKLIGNWIYFMPQAIIESDDEDGVTTILASRKEALRRLRILNYVGTRRRGPTIEKGMICDARVVSVGEQVLTIELGGHEQKVYKEFLTNRYFATLESHYKVNDIVPVYVAAVAKRRDERGNVVDVRPALSAHVAEVEIHRKNLKGLKIGSTCEAQISKIRRRGEADSDGFRFYGWVKYENVPLKITNLPNSIAGRPLTIGDTVSIIITGKDIDGDGYARGLIISGQRNSNDFN